MSIFEINPLIQDEVGPRLFKIGDRPLEERPLWKKAVEFIYQVSPITRAPIASGLATGGALVGSVGMTALFASAALFITGIKMMKEQEEHKGLFLTDAKLADVKTRLEERRAQDEQSRMGVSGPNPNSGSSL